MKVLLIEPNFHSFALLPPISLTVLKGYINTKTTHHVKILDFNRQAAETIRRDEVLLMLEKVSATFELQIKALSDLLEAIREREGKVLLTLGLALVALAGNFALQLVLHMAAKH